MRSSHEEATLPHNGLTNGISTENLQHEVLYDGSYSNCGDDHIDFEALRIEHLSYDAQIHNKTDKTAKHYRDHHRHNGRRTEGRHCRIGKISTKSKECTLSHVQNIEGAPNERQAHCAEGIHCTKR